ncbi:hypothetical protein SELMODRAFT_444137 [Selaginella moellendorffii]|uniref:TFIIS N-terminal domain-containing protein n=2 Tax=Selaginella moellendorffii TaxID=88036 RepID=D8S782_SELML|nr:hypothetical protein SELMODRAFT_447387 [Selaginella moellendorffii]EFJ19562.1 hypothetical protein SELMODRAFT_444137 [Selaginella moellendorffii]
MERWRLFFENSGEDLWSVIDWALTIAAVNYPKELRMRRDGFAEKLFAPSNYPLVATNCGGGAPLLLAGGSDRKDSLDRDHDDDQGEEEENADARNLAPADDDEEEAVRREVLSIGQTLERDQNEPAEKLLKPIERLEQLQISVQALKVTGIGMIVNKLRKHHKSSRVKAGCKKLVKLWKDVVDEWAKTADAADADELALPNEAVNEVEVIEERLPHRVDLLSSSVSSVTQPPPLQMLDNGGEDSMFGCSPSDDREDHHKSHRISYPPSEHSKMLNGPSFQPSGKWMDDDRTRTGRAPVAAPSSASARKPPTTKPSRPSFQESGSLTEKQKLETTKRLIHDQYQQAANVKRQRTVQVMDMQDVPQDRPGNHLKAGSGNTRRPVQR